MHYIKFIAVILIAYLAGCTDRSDSGANTTVPTPVEDTASVNAPAVDKPSPDTIATPTSEIYANARFRNVRVEKIGTNKFQLTGEAQIFEASFNWVVEDGHNELKSGFSTTDAGAPAWGKFNFNVQVAKEREHSVLHIILYEASAKDGRRTHQLPILLPEF